MKTARKAILMVLCVIALVVASVMGTLAYFTDTEAVTNTFTIGKIEMTLDEADTNEYGEKLLVDDPNSDDPAVKIPAARVAANEYKLIPGHTYIKDPIVHMNADSENAWVFVMVENGISAIEKTDASIHGQIISDTYGWTQLKNAADEVVPNVYYKSWTNGSSADLPVFGTFTIDGDKAVNGTAGDGEISIDNYATAADASKLIKVTAYAIQMDGFNSTENTQNVNAWNAWSALNEQLN